MQSLDIIRLRDAAEKILNNEQPRRGEGFTTAILYLMLGEIDLGTEGNTYLYVGDADVAASSAARRFKQLLSQQNVPTRVIQYNKIVTQNDMSFLFIGVEQFTELYSIRGLNINRVFCDVSHVLQVEHHDRIEDTLVYMCANGADII